MKTDTGPLAGIRVIDLTTQRAWLLLNEPHAHKDLGMAHYRAGREDAAAPCRPVGLRVHRAHPVSRGVNHRERRHRERGRAGKHDVQRRKMALSQITSSAARRRRPAMALIIAPEPFLR